MKPLTTIITETRKASEHFYNSYCHQDKCPNCPLKHDEINDCFASCLDYIADDLENLYYQLSKITEDK